MGKKLEIWSKYIAQIFGNFHLALSPIIGGPQSCANIPTTTVTISHYPIKIPLFPFHSHFPIFYSHYYFNPTFCISFPLFVHLSNIPLLLLFSYRPIHQINKVQQHGHMTCHMKCSCVFLGQKVWVLEIPVIPILPTASPTSLKILKVTWFKPSQQSCAVDDYMYYPIPLTQPRKLSIRKITQNHFNCTIFRHKYTNVNK